jgi:hypothetical protein
LLPALDLTTRANAWALLWGEQPELTQQWLTLAHTLQQTGHAQELAAPLSLLVDHFGLPAESFLTQVALTGNNEAQSDVVVHPIENHQLLNAVSLSLSSLALLTRELVLTVEDAVLENVDLLDIPRPGYSSASTVAGKIRLDAGTLSPAPATGCALNLQRCLYPRPDARHHPQAIGLG